MKAQLTLTVNEAKSLIAQAVIRLPHIRKAKEKGKILLKGGTTVSAVAKELVGLPLRISGRITPDGTRSARKQVTAPHSLLVEKGIPRGVDHELEEVALSMGPGDVLVCGANLIDCAGNAAIMAGSPLGGPPGRILAALAAEGVTTIVPAGLEKLSPGSVDQAIMAAGRQSIDWSLGMAVGLIPLPGEVITELNALPLLARVQGTVIGRGGIAGAEGATTLVVEGAPGEIEKVCKMVLSLKGAATGGARESLEECRQGGYNCRQHLGCLYGGKALTWGGNEE